jgi:hypothetical protein
MDLKRHTMRENPRPPAKNPCTFITYVLYDHVMKRRQGTAVKPIISQLAIRIGEEKSSAIRPDIKEDNDAAGKAPVANKRI